MGATLIKILSCTQFPFISGIVRVEITFFLQLSSRGKKHKKLKERNEKFSLFWCVKNVCAHFNQHSIFCEAFNPETLLMDVKLLPLERFLSTFRATANALYRKSVISVF